MKIFLIAVAAIPLMICNSEAQSLKESLMTMVETERAFAALSLSKGIKAAFLANLADDGVLFRPGPVNGKEVWSKRPDSSAARLEWAPVYADIAASGDVGYTTGWSVFTPSPDLDQPPYCGYFVTVWKKQSDSNWKFALDIGIGNSYPEKVDKSFSAGTATGKVSKGGNVKTEKARIARLEKEFSKLSTSGTVSAIRTHGASTLRLYRDGDIPSVNRNQALERLAILKERLTLSVEELFVASSCDFAYTYGKYEARHASVTEPMSGYYVHIWKKSSSNTWQLVLDILNPPPPRK